jgi:hypothetical protein
MVDLPAVELREDVAELMRGSRVAAQRGYSPTGAAMAVAAKHRLDGEAFDLLAAWACGFALGMQLVLGEHPLEYRYTDARRRASYDIGVVAGQSEDALAVFPAVWGGQRGL